MTNSDIINKLKISSRLTWEERCFVVNNYRKAKPNESNNWKAVCLEGSDFKYGSWLIDPEKMIQRSKTFDEFYEGGIVD